MILTRASFLRLFGMAAVGAGLDPISLTSTFRIEDASASHFAPLVGDGFAVRAGGTAATLRLAKVDERPLTRNVAQFSLIFHGPAGDALPDAIYALRHPALGTFSAFVIAVGLPAADRRVYQACFSRFVRT